MSVTGNEFRNAMSRFASGVTVIVSKDADERLHGITVSAFSSVSLSPPLVLICIEKTTGSHEALASAEHFTVNVLSSEQQETSQRFASWSPDKFNDLDMTTGELGLPILNGCLANLECKMSQAIDAGDHTIFIGEVAHAHVFEGDPLIYFRSDYRGLE
ncbi:MAG: flavin reductase family protein [Acidobacteria bacterium]|nr:flavin reductase family protein [Acidobacteriota bacterium]